MGGKKGARKMLKFDSTPVGESSKQKKSGVGAAISPLVKGVVGQSSGSTSKVVGGSASKRGKIGVSIGNAKRGRLSVLRSKKRGTKFADSDSDEEEKEDLKNSNTLPPVTCGLRKGDPQKLNKEKEKEKDEVKVVEKTCKDKGKEKVGAATAKTSSKDKGKEKVHDYVSPKIKNKPCSEDEGEGEWGKQ